MEDLKNKILIIIAETLEVTKDKITDDTIIGDLPEWDSIHHVMLINNLENNFNIKLTQESLLELEDVTDLINLIQEITE